MEFTLANRAETFELQPGEKGVLELRPAFRGDHISYVLLTLGAAELWRRSTRYHVTTERVVCSLRGRTRWSVRLASIVSLQPRTYNKDKTAWNILLCALADDVLALSEQHKIGPLRQSDGERLVEAIRSVLPEDTLPLCHGCSFNERLTWYKPALGYCPTCGTAFDPLVDLLSAIPIPPQEAGRLGNGLAVDPKETGFLARPPPGVSAGYLHLSTIPKDLASHLDKGPSPALLSLTQQIVLCTDEEAAVRWINANAETAEWLYGIGDEAAVVAEPPSKRRRRASTTVHIRRDRLCALIMVNTYEELDLAPDLIDHAQAVLQRMDRALDGT